MSVLVSPDDPRGPQAIVLVVEDKWKRHFDTSTRQVCFDIPSSPPGRNYRTTADGCTCSDLKYRPWTVCNNHDRTLREIAEVLPTLRFRWPWERR